MFPEVVSHDDCRLYTEGHTKEVAIAAGYVYINPDKAGIESMILYGSSVTLPLGADTAYQEWRDRFLSSGLVVQCLNFERMKLKSFFLPFQPIEQFQVRGIGASVPVEGCTLEDVIASIK